MTVAGTAGCCRVLVALVPVAAGVVALLWWRGPDWTLVGDAFEAVALGVGGRGDRAQPALGRRARVRVAHRDQAGDRRRRTRASARLLGLLRRPVRERGAARTDRRARARRGADAEDAARRQRHLGRRSSARSFAHRLFDLFPALGLVVWVLLDRRRSRTGRSTSLDRGRGIGFALLAFAFATARGTAAADQDGLGRDAAAGGDGAGTGSASCTGRRRRGGRVLPVPRLDLPAARGLRRRCGRSASTRRCRRAGLVLVLMNVATIFPLWPGNIGLLQAAIALPLAPYGVAYGEGDRVRLRPPGDRGVGRHRRRPDLPRARGALVRDAAAGCRMRPRQRLPEDEQAGPRPGRRARRARARVPG